MTQFTNQQIILRPRQEQMVEKVLHRLIDEDKASTLCVAPTGAGKTIMLASIVGRYLQHVRDNEITDPST